MRDLTSPRALVIRDGERKRVAGREVVRGDAIVLLEGDRGAADAALAVANNLQVDESLLTGESVPVRKSAGDGDEHVPMGRPGGDDLPFVFSGSLVVRGDGIGDVSATGAHSEIGKIGQASGRIATEPPRLQQQTRRLVRLFRHCRLAGQPARGAALRHSARRLAAMRCWRGIALGMSMLPEEFPVVLTVFMAMGAWRISLARVLTRRAAAIETLGSATVLCTDKTGTLTENRMTIVELRLNDGNVSPAGWPEMPAQFHDLSEFGLLASAPEPFDPMERAFHALARERRTEAAYRLRTGSWCTPTVCGPISSP